MISYLFNTLIYNPLYNGLVFLLEVFPFIDVGVAVILLTILVKLVLFPMSRAAVRTQILLRTLAPELERIKKKHKDDSQAQAQATMELYRKNGVNPFSGFLLILVQLPIILALYFIFLRGGLPDINTEILYSFIEVPKSINMIFLNVLDISQPKNLILAIITGATQYIQITLATPKKENTKKGGQGSLAENFATSMQFQMRYVMPIIVAVISYTLPAIVGLYWATSNLFTIGQEFVVRRQTANSPRPQPTTKIKKSP